MNESDEKSIKMFNDSQDMLNEEEKFKNRDINDKDTSENNIINVVTSKVTITFRPI